MDVAKEKNVVGVARGVIYTATYCVCKELPLGSKKRTYVVP